jgi:exopolysaccharide biosynthesis glucuronosyltransferase PssE
VIFVTVGAQMAFDRLVHGVDEWARGQDRTDCFAQVGKSASPPTFIQWERFVPPEEFRRLVENCRAIVAHAGMGTIITALQHNKPILVMPRRGSLRETRNDHQVATAEHFAAQGRVLVARDEHELPERLVELMEHRAADSIREFASDELLGSLRTFLQDGKIPPASAASTHEHHSEGQA